MSSSRPDSRPANRLAREKSPYLLQHAHNPVDWFPWGDEAFEKAKKEEKPIFLSIGYSTCHWCHVMERESFEDASIAAFLNQHFVSIKVDREERPDVDRIYMTYVQAVTGSGGWPMSVWLTPERKPFYGGTYFPPFSKFGRPGFLDVLKGILQAWNERRAELTDSAAKAIESLRAQTATEAPGEVRLREEMMAGGYSWFQRAYDDKLGGFGGAPKFPRPSVLLFLFRWHRRTGDRAPLEMAAHTLRAMARGGIHDHLGGGFHRYSVDARWHVPHFEKMLYDQGQLALAYAEGFQLTGDPELEAALRGICDYVLRDLLSPQGAFFSAEDADSVVSSSVVSSSVVSSSVVPGAAADPNHPEKREGAFYVFSAAELKSLLGDGAAAFSLRFGVEETGNADDPHGELTGQNVLFVAREIDEVAKRLGIPNDEAAKRIDAARRKCFEARARRPRPHLDDKILAGWNGLMISGLAAAGRVLGEPRYVEAAARAARFVIGTMRDPKTKELRRRFRDGETALRGQCDDYAYLVQGLLDLYEADLDPNHLETALDLARIQDQLFLDATSGAWFSSPGGDPTILLRPVEDYDGAEPAPTSVAARNALRLAELTGDETQRKRGEGAVRAFGSRLEAMPAALPQMLVSLDACISPAEHIVITGGTGSADLLRIARARYLPNAALVALDTPERQSWFSKRLPFTAAMKPQGGRALAFVCVDRACRLPVSEPKELDAALAASRPAPR